MAHAEEIVDQQIQTNDNVVGGADDKSSPDVTERCCLGDCGITCQEQEGGIAQAGQIVGQPVQAPDNVVGEEPQIADEEPLPKLTELCCLGYIILFFSILELIQASASVILSYWMGEDPCDKCIRIVRILDAVNCIAIPFAIFFLGRDAMQAKPLLRGCETCRCRCHCAFLPITFAVIALMCFVLQGLIYMNESDILDVDVLYCSFAWCFMLACLSVSWIIALHEKGQLFCI